MNIFYKLLLVFSDNININDVLGDYQLTLIDTLDTLAVRYFYCFILNSKQK